MLAAMLTRFGLYANMFGGGGNNRDNNNGPPVWLIVMLVSIVPALLMRSRRIPAGEHDPAAERDARVAPDNEDGVSPVSAF